MWCCLNSSDSIRVKHIGDPELAQSQAYRVSVRQVPINLGHQARSAVRMVVTFNTLASVFVQVRGNSQTRLQVSSENRGRMVHRQYPDQSIDYNINIDGVSTALRAPLELTRRPARDVEGSDYPMVITIGDTGGKFAGHYHDIVSIEVSPE